MIVKMSEKDTGSDIDKAFTLFEDKEKRDKFIKEQKPEVITKASQMKVVKDLGNLFHKNPKLNSIKNRRGHD